MAHRIDKLANKKWGIFTHHLSHIQNFDKHTSWNDCVNEFDVKKFAKTLNEIKA